MTERTLHVAGAGPAGLAAAITAARAGVRVVVHEIKDGVGTRFHGDFQGLENWTVPVDVLEEFAAAGLEPTFDHVPVRRQSFFGPDGRLHDYESTEPFYYLVRRGPGPGTIDTSLLAQARAAGVEVRFRDRVADLDEGIVAHGPRGTDAIAVGYLFDTDMDDCMYGVLDDRLAPGGYAYLLVSGGRGTIATCMFADFDRGKECRSRVVEYFDRRVGVTLRDPRPFGGAGNAGFPESATRGRVLYVGEAAGFQDALWGFGIRYAVLSGHLAARAHVEGRPEIYERLWRARIGGHLRAAVVNRFLYDRGRTLAYRYILRGLDRARDPRAWLRAKYAPGLVVGALFPFARAALRLSADRRRPGGIAHAGA